MTSLNDTTLTKVTYGKYATRVPDEVAYGIYEWFSSQLNTLLHIIKKDIGEEKLISGNPVGNPVGNPSEPNRNQVKRLVNNK